MKQEIREEFWHAFEDSPFIMMKLQDAPGHAEPMTAQLDRDAHHEIWFFAARDNRIAAGGKAMGQFASKGHDVFACVDGTLVEETRQELREKHWNNFVEAWFPNGKTDPNVVMLRLDIEEAEVWVSDASIKGKLKMLAGMEVKPSEVGKHAVGLV